MIVCAIGCAKDPIPGPPPGYYDDPYKSIRDKIDSLERSPKNEWIASTDSCEQINTIKELEDLIQPISFSEDERRQLLSDYEQAHTTYHFGYEGNYHALVFFTSTGNPIRVEKW